MSVWCAGSISWRLRVFDALMRFKYQTPSHVENRHLLDAPVDDALEEGNVFGIELIEDIKEPHMMPVAQENFVALALSDTQAVRVDADAEVEMKDVPMASMADANESEDDSMMYLMNYDPSENA